MNNLVAIYCRLSEEDRNKLFKTDDSGSIQNQKNKAGRYMISIPTTITPAPIGDVRRLTGCFVMPSSISLISSFVKPSPGLPVSWNWWKNTYMDYSLFGGFALFLL